MVDGLSKEEGTGREAIPQVRYQEVLGSVGKASRKNPALIPLWAVGEQCGGQGIGTGRKVKEENTQSGKQISSPFIISFDRCSENSKVTSFYFHGCYYYLLPDLPKWQ